MKVILASGSPRRRELMEMLGIRCKVQASGAEEVVTSAEPEKVVEELSRLKCLDVAEITEGDAVVIGADTVVAFEGEILGKLYDKSVGEFIEEDNGWYKITSGSVTGYVKAEYCVTGDDAVALAKKVGNRIATVTTTTLKVREEPSLDATVLGLVPIQDQLLVTE